MMNSGKSMDKYFLIATSLMLVCACLQQETGQTKDIVLRQLGYSFLILINHCYPLFPHEGFGFVGIF